MNTLFRNKSGFTLVELLIVVTIIGILAVAVLAAINPIEQFNKTRDTGRKTDAGQILNAIERYYTSNDKFPWNVKKNQATGSVSIAVVGSGGTSSGTGTGWPSTGMAVSTMFQNLVDQGELKQSFVDKYLNKELSNFEYMYIVKKDKSSEISVCFQPQSQALQKTGSVRYTPTFNAGSPILFDVVANTSKLLDTDLWCFSYLYGLYA